MSEYDAIYEVELELQLREVARAWKRSADEHAAKFHERLATEGIAYTISWNAEAAIGAEFLGRQAEYLIGLLDDGKPSPEVYEAIQHQLRSAVAEGCTIRTTSIFADAKARAEGYAAQRATEFSWRPGYAKDRTNRRVAGNLMQMRDELIRSKQLAKDRMDRARSEQSRERHAETVGFIDGEIAEMNGRIEAAIEYAKTHNHSLDAAVA